MNAYARILAAATTAIALCPPTSSAARTKPSTVPAAPVHYRLSALAYPKDVASERAYLQGIERQIAELTRRASSARERPAQVPLLLSLANLRLARQTEPDVTRLVLGDTSGTARQRVVRVANLAQAEIRQALRLLAEAEKSSPPNKAAARQRARWKQTAEQLSVLAACVVGFGDKAGATAALERLAPLMKSKQPDLVSATKLLEVMLLRTAGQVDKALTLTQSPVTRPGHLPHGFFVRLLHCHLLADRGHHAIATILALQMDVQCEEWFDKSRLPEARRAVGLLRIDLARRWADRLQRDRLDEHAARRRAVARQVRDELFGREDATVYRLILTVPVLIEPPPPPPAPVTTRRTPTAPRPTTMRPTPASAATRPPTSTRSDPPTRPSTKEGSDAGRSSRRRLTKPLEE